MENLFDVLQEELRDIHSAESQLLQIMPMIVREVQDRELIQTLKFHFEESKFQLKRLHEIGMTHGFALIQKECLAMKGLITELMELLQADYSQSGLKDVLIVSAMQRIEHYEIAVYGNAIALAEYLDLEDIVSTLHETIEEERNTKKKLSQICQGRLFDLCPEPFTEAYRPQA